MNVGDKVKFGPPVGYLRYNGNGSFNNNETTPFEHTKTELGLVCGGTGITPCLAVAESCLKSGDKIKISLLYFNKTLDDILAKDRIDALVK